MSERILALDFDGVVWDSVGECFALALQVFEEGGGQAAPEVAAGFRRGRWLVRTGGDFWIVFQLAVEDPNRDWEAYSRSEFNALRLRLAEPAEEFAQRFYALREQWRRLRPAQWQALQRPYPEFVAELPSLQQAFRELVICTTKDEDSARALLATIGLGELAIWGRGHGTDKAEQMRDLCVSRQVEPAQVTFVDDLLENLEQVEPLGVHCFLAGWGYNTPAEQAQARERGLGVLRFPDLVGQLQVGV